MQLYTYLFLLYFHHRGEKGLGQRTVFLQAIIKRKPVSLLNEILSPIPLFPKSIKHSYQVLTMAQQATHVSPCKGLSCFLVASGGVRPVKVALLHLHAHSRRSRQQTSLVSKREIKPSVSLSHFGGQSSAKGGCSSFQSHFKFLFQTRKQSSLNLYCPLWQRGGEIFTSQ